MANDPWFRPNWQNVNAGGVLMIGGFAFIGYGIWLVANGALDAGAGLFGGGGA